MQPINPPNKIPGYAIITLYRNIILTRRGVGCVQIPHGCYYNNNDCSAYYLNVWEYTDLMIYYNTTCFAYLLRSLSSYGAICFQSNLSRGDTDDTDEDERDAAPRRRRRSPSAARTTNGNHLHPVDRFFHDKVQVSGKRDFSGPVHKCKAFGTDLWRTILQHTVPVPPDLDDQ